MITPFSCVVDASVGIKQFISDPLSVKTIQLFDKLSEPSTKIFIPDLFYVECANVLWKYSRAGYYAATELEEDLEALKSLPLQVISTAELIVEAVKIGVKYEISAYDGCYVALSEQVKVPLLTLDRKLVRKLEKTTYQVFSFEEFDLG
jgi:predicted nucleic acid-binding protein